MPDTEIETPTPDTETPAPKPDETPKPDEAPKPDETPKPADKVDELPDFAQKMIRDLRAENANYRTRATSAEQKLADAKTPEDVEAAVAEIKAENAKLARDLLVTRVAVKHELPSELAELLKGDDEAALEAHAKTLAKFAGSQNEPGDLSGGLNPGTPEQLDPVKAAQQARRRRY